MKFNKKGLVRSELIGLNIKIIESENKFNKGIKGKIIDETKNMFEIKTKETRKKIIKDQCVFEFIIKGEKIQIDGKSLTKRPEERIKQR
jgi:ribonuclease P protein subunit POP4